METRCFSSATQVKPCQAGLGTIWVTHCEYSREGSYFGLCFLLLLFCVLCGVIFKIVFKSILGIISAAGFRENKNRRKAIFNWAAKGLFFLRGGAAITDTLATINPCRRPLRETCETET